MSEHIADYDALAQAMRNHWLTGVIFNPSPSGPPDIDWQRWAGLVRDAVIDVLARDIDRLLLRVEGFGEPWDRGYCQGVQDAAYAVREHRVTASTEHPDADA